MNTEIIYRNLKRLDDDTVIQSLIAQVNARYILLNTSEQERNHPPYTITDHGLNILAFTYLNLGCSLAENKNLEQAALPLEKGASILEAIHAPINNRKSFSNYYSLISAMAYYAGFQYSKAFILTAKVSANTPIANLISFFLRREFYQLNEAIYAILLSNEYSDSNITEHFDRDGNVKIYEILIAKSLDFFVKYYQSGNQEFLEKARNILLSAKEIAEIEADPGIWWVLRFLLLITGGFNLASLWNVLGRHFNTEADQIKNYIHSLVFREPHGIYELFVSQRRSLDKVLNKEQLGCVVSIPTSSGKTRIAEIAILNSLQHDPNRKVLYIAPFRSLAFEVENELERVFEHSDIVVSHLYGGGLYSQLDELAVETANIIIATPEKAKAITRANVTVTYQIGLTIIDEGHLLGESKRLVMNEAFYEELRYYAETNNGRFLLLSAVLPNAEDIALWLTGSSDTVYRENWRPSDERLGIMDWIDGFVNLNWESQDKERASFNRAFVEAKPLPLKGRQRKQRYFPGDKNDAIAATALRLQSFGPVLIFVGLKPSVFVMAKSYLQALGEEAKFHKWKNFENWRAYELASIECYGADNIWLTYAQHGILCHNADLHVDVRLPLERLMRNDKPLVIISTSTLGQGVNLGVSTVIFSTLYQSGQELSKRDFWNIAGRAGRAFMDHEGKILVALDSNGMNSFYKRSQIKKIREYFDKSSIDNAQSGILSLIISLKDIAEENNVDFDLLLELITENKLDEIGEEAIRVESTLDWIDDALLSLQLLHNPDGPVDVTWTEDYFRKSLAAIQASKSADLTTSQVFSFLSSRVEGIIEKVGSDRNKWHSLVQSGIPLNSDLLLEERLPLVLATVQGHSLLGDSIDDKINLLKEIEEIIKDLPVITEKGNFLDNPKIDEIRDLWVKARAVSEIVKIESAINVITDLYTFTLPWVLNGISKKMRAIGNDEEAVIVEELSVLVETGLPSTEKVKIYQTGIRSRTSANELGDIFEADAITASITQYKRELLANIDRYKALVSKNTAEWLDMLRRNSGKRRNAIKRITFSFGNVHRKTDSLIVRSINDRIFLMSPDLSFIKETSGKVDFSSVNNVPGVKFVYNHEKNHWESICDNPNVEFID